MNAPDTPVLHSPPGAAVQCYHCGLPVDGPVRYRVRVAGEDRPMCCAGCAAVAQAIAGGGLEAFYAHRDTLSPKAEDGSGTRDLTVYDLPEVQADFVRTVAHPDCAQAREALLIIEGIRCAACVWLNEQHVGRLPGLLDLDINYATRRARVVWDPARISLSGILRAVAEIGYEAWPNDKAHAESVARNERRDALWRLAVAGLGMMQVMMYAWPEYIAGELELPGSVAALMRWASLVLTAPVVCYSAAPFFARAWRDLSARRIGMDLPVALGVGSAFIASVWATVTHSGEVYFDSVTMFVFLLLGGRYLEMLARQRAVRGVEELARVMPALARRLVTWPGSATEAVPVARLAAGDHVAVAAGEVFPADGRLVDGRSEVDESLLTGESRPQARAPGDRVVGGSVNIASPVVLEVEQVGEATRLAAIRRLIGRASASRPEVVQFADRVAVHFVSALIVLAALTGAIWLWLDPSRALWIFVAVLVVSCPCALSLATPAALTVGTGVMSRSGLLVTRAHAIETLARVTHVVFDKTGTLTTGNMKVQAVHPSAAMDAAHMLAVAAALEGPSAHPIARALRERAGALAATDLSAQTGKGVQGQVAGRLYRLGRADYVCELSGATPPASAGASSATPVWLGDQHGLIGRIDLSDELRAGARALLARLRERGIGITLLSGDAEEPVRALAGELDIADAQARMSPEDKRARIEALQAHGAVVAMLGDGVNDAPVLAQAHVSVAMGSGTELARAQGDLVLLSDRFDAMTLGLDTARATLAIVRQNLRWAFAYNLLAIPPAMLGWITPWMAGIGMSLSSLLVVLNALRLQRRHKVD
ncbi:heavy metal translocating P-type ATPase [Methyloversatilis thermotolerans]|uniref:heavy metal translocating P-type ATPase n=1 Tax=Methyloversatilis thermotolerans TaxID=1346290 RepID=UPI000378DEAF|nr:heavy metal translocating P-type ATPase [Methyloversatilis thermotolerans]